MRSFRKYICLFLLLLLVGGCNSDVGVAKNEPFFCVTFTSGVLQSTDSEIDNVTHHSSDCILPSQIFISFVVRADGLSHSSCSSICRAQHYLKKTLTLVAHVKNITHRVMSQGRINGYYIYFIRKIII